MNLQKLFEAQAELDAYIEQQHPTQEGENRLEKKVLALLVELGECANEWRGFKFWSNDQEPNTFVPNPKDVCLKCSGTGMLDEEKEFIERRFCDDCDGCGNHYHNALLEEFVDCLHFILSIGNDLHFDYEEFLKRQAAMAGDINLLFIDVMASTTEIILHYRTDFARYSLYATLRRFLKIGRKLGFTEEQIEEAYWKKYEINKQRQRDGY
ncbi:dUTP diphosphatase [Kurthia gibsonii]|uniref:dUTP diphosphatase n=1 Tax=Kurthia gibsonii TaxID=33946 RepID=UPI0031B67C54